MHLCNGRHPFFATLALEFYVFSFLQNINLEKFQILGYYLRHISE